MKHQREGAGFALYLRNKGYGGWCLADEPGTGKTHQIIALLFEAQRTPGRPHLLIVPAALMDKWIADFDRSLTEKAKSEIYVHSRKYHSSSDPVMTENTLRGFRVVLVNYEGLTAEVSRFEKWARFSASKWKSYEDRQDEALALASKGGFAPPRSSNKKKRKRGAQVEFDEGDGNESVAMGEWPLGQIQWDIVALDESHNVLNADSQTFAAVDSLRRNFLAAVSGTLLKNSYREVGAICRLIRLYPLDDLDFFKRVS